MIIDTRSVGDVAAGVVSRRRESGAAGGQLWTGAAIAVLGVLVAPGYRPSVRCF